MPTADDSGSSVNIRPSLDNGFCIDRSSPETGVSRFLSFEGGNSLLESSVSGCSSLCCQGWCSCWRSGSLPPAVLRGESRERGPNLDAAPGSGEGDAFAEAVASANAAASSSRWRLCCAIAETAASTFRSNSSSETLRLVRSTVSTKWIAPD